jgi:NADPH:quinone reductase-like Zn-dependent oxidoreductase
MSSITTEAWVLYAGSSREASGNGDLSNLKRESFSFPDITDTEALVEPIYGCWEGNMTHAMERRPVDICHQRGEEKVVIGNAGLVRVIKTGKSVNNVKEGDLCLLTGIGVKDDFGFMVKAFGYDARDTVGLLAKQTKMPADILIPMKKDTKYSLKQWAAFSVRYITAWANWKMAYGCYRLAISEQEYPSPHVWGWGGGVAIAELQLAREAGCQVAMIASKDERLEMIRRKGITPIDRRLFMDLYFDEERFNADSAYRKAYKRSERKFIEVMNEHTNGRGVSIFIDYIGAPVLRATLKALARPGVVTTAGWKCGMNIPLVRAVECINWHTHIHTHYARPSEAVEAVEFAEKSGWLPDLDADAYSWDDIPQLAYDYANEKVSTYFPLFEVNRL